MKKSLFCLSLSLFVLSLLAMAGFMVYPQVRIGGDFDLRYNEMRCVLDGVDPYDVWSGKIERAPYYPMENTHPSEGFTRRVNAYPPWAYTIGLPLVCLPERASWMVYFLFNILAAFGLALVGYRYAREKLGDRDDARLAAIVPALLTVLTIGSCFQSGNYPMVVLAAMVAMVWCLNRGHDILAGFCWAIAMIKPQMALLLAVPLLFRRKILTCAVAFVTCLVASVPPMILCHKGLVELIRNGINGSAHAFFGCGTFPSFLLPLFGSSLSINLGLAIGLALCVFLTWKTPKSAGWFVFLTPAVFIASVWTYSQLYASVVNWFVFTLILIELLRAPRSKALWAIFILSAIFLMRLYTFYHGFTLLAPERFGYSWALHGLLDSLNAFFGLLILIGFWYGAYVQRKKPFDRPV